MRTNKAQLDAYLEQMNHALSRRGSKKQVTIRTGYGLVGLSELKDGNIARDITGLMKKSELAAYMRAAINGIWMFE